VQSGCHRIQRPGKQLGIPHSRSDSNGKGNTFVLTFLYGLTHQDGQPGKGPVKRRRFTGSFWRMPRENPRGSGRSATTVKSSCRQQDYVPACTSGSFQQTAELRWQARWCCCPGRRVWSRQSAVSSPQSAVGSPQYTLLLCYSVTSFTSPPDPLSAPERGRFIPRHLRHFTAMVSISIRAPRGSFTTA